MRLPGRPRACDIQVTFWPTKVSIGPKDGFNHLPVCLGTEDASGFKSRVWPRALKMNFKPGIFTVTDSESEVLESALTPQAASVSELEDGFKFEFTSLTPISLNE